MRRKTRFWLGFLFVVLLYLLPIGGLAYAGLIWPLALAVAAFVFSVYFVYWVTIRNAKLKYPLVNPEGRPDVYTGRMPRPIYEDVQRYPWFFRKKRGKKQDEKERHKKD
jgi:hypothetical protein